MRTKGLNAVRSLVAVMTMLAVGGNHAFANYPVIDISNLMNAVTQLYAIYDEINATIEQVQNTYQQLQKQIDSVKNMNWDDLASSFDNWDESGGLGGAWNNIGNFRTNLTNATNAINDNMNLINDVKHTLENKTVTCMGKKYTVAGLFGVGRYGQNNLMNLPRTAVDYAKETGKDIAAGYAGRLTYREKEAIMRKWGLDPENYAYVKLVEEQVSDLTSTLFSKGTDEYYTAELAQAAANNEAILALSNNAGESITGQMQATTGAILSLKQDILNLSHGVRETGAMFAAESTKRALAEDVKKENDANRRERIQLEFQKATGYVPGWL
ncbi:MAG: hypothetical protein IJ530_10105 [Treponema sp.]|uniref:hypothetical protein n=1 Tax=Treponema sp. TaxID=166 RepID=UPI0025F88576|nr:hypothetical protein [Treponema sp.]MBQ8680101.1 hypothetical protein [Treponema sp.]